jgi:hypothetical protein
VRALMISILVVAAPQARADVWSALEGSWRGGGTVRAMAADVELVIRPALDGRGRHLAFRNRMRGAEGKEWLFAAEALYQCDAAGACRGHWYDSRGEVLPLVASAGTDRLVVEWGDASTERGRTTYALERDDELAITDEVLGRDGAWREFGIARAGRSP